jgi:DNA-directed RNA polymerase specialized sigma24 family protein
LVCPVLVVLVKESIMLGRHDVCMRFAECQPALLSFALRLTGSVHEAEDLAQETLLRACEKWSQYDQSKSAKS